MKLISSILKGLVIIVGALILVYFLGPKVEPPSMDETLPEVTSDLIALEREINKKENSFSNIRPDNQARIIWFDSIPKKTEYSIVYLHGWSASQEEGDPIHLQTAKRYGCNLYLPRLAGHGLDEDEAMLGLTADQVIDSAKEAIAIGKKLGQKIILMATSTGGTLALHLAGGDSDIAALLLYSPNVEIYDPNAKLLTKPWGLELAKMVKGGDYHEFDTDIALKNQYWTTKYRLEALTHLQAMVDYTMTTETFKEVKQPVFLGYFYKNETVQDNVVSVPAMLQMFNELGTPTNKKRKVAFPNAGDHVMTSYVSSKDLESVQRETNKFIESILEIDQFSSK
ncbi:alpha/beta hydrolase [Croceitalea rosinachiae]|uniref:Alpha/beta hydrolase n=1 Tax=Croceitalea rosinachiae TaxID=3075596 RepID=A0ABU3A630_9FLAO|nr:alpha/beta hydrolase [Croceitalea sp. F388]MDT0605632.1 alpha/beta hydrolase [Croceitalea sp. F388]